MFAQKRLSKMSPAAEAAIHAHPTYIGERFLLGSLIICLNRSE
jgi:hypothetical protein